MSKKTITTSKVNHIRDTAWGPPISNMLRRSILNTGYISATEPSGCSRVHAPPKAVVANMMPQLLVQHGLVGDFHNTLGYLRNPFQYDYLEQSMLNKSWICWTFFLNIPVLSNNMLDVKTDGYSVNPTLQHGALREVPTFTRQNDEHFSARWTAKSLALERRRHSRANLGCAAGGTPCFRVWSYELYIHVHKKSGATQNCLYNPVWRFVDKSCLCKSRNANPDTLLRSM